MIPKDRSPAAPPSKSDSASAPPLEHGLIKKHLKKPVDRLLKDPRKGQRVIIGIAGANLIVATVEGFTLIQTEPYSLSTLAATSVGSVASTLFFCFPNPRHLNLAVVVTLISGIVAAASLVATAEGAIVLTSIFFALLWSTFFNLSMRFQLGVALFSIAALYFFGAEFTFFTRHGQDARYISAVEIFCFIIAPVSLGGLLQYHEQQRGLEQELQLNALSEERNRLETQYRQKSEELDRSRQALIKAERHKTTSRIAEGLAHELNNMLTPIHGLAELMVKNPQSPRNEQYAHSIMYSARSASMLTQALLTYTRKGEFHPQAHRACQMMEDLVLPELRDTIPDNIRLSWDFDPDIYIDADHHLWKLCIWHLARNGIEAMPRGGELHLSFQVAAPNPNLAPSPASPTDSSSDALRDLIQPGEEQPEWVRCTVRDTGRGIAAEDLSRIFDPFFTTKTFGVGAGIGLALVEGAIAQHGGRVELESQVGKGTSVHLFVPRTNTKNKSGSSLDTEGKPKAADLKGFRRAHVAATGTERSDLIPAFDR